MENYITIAVCVYNCEKYIEETLTCIINQTFQKFDLLIVNDCSTDNTVTIIKDFFANHPNDYRLINLEKNGGIANARQIALQKAITSYIVFLDADDRPDKNLLKEEYNTISSDKDIMAVSCWSKFIDEKGRTIKGGIFIGSRNKDEFMRLASREKLIFLPVQTLFNRMLALNVGGYRLDGFPEGKPRYQDFCEDLDIWTRMSDLYVEGKYMITIPKVLYWYRKGNTGLSSNSIYMSLKMKFVKKNLKLRRVGEEEISFIDYLNSVTEEEMWQMQRDAKVGYCLRNGVFRLRKGRVLTGVFYIGKSIVMNPKYFLDKVKNNFKLLK